MRVEDGPIGQKNISLNKSKATRSMCMESVTIFSSSIAIICKEIQKLESIWCGFLRQMVKVVSLGKMLLRTKKDKTIPDDEIDWSLS